MVSNNNKSVVNLLKWYSRGLMSDVYSSAKLLKNKILGKRKQWILSRTSCLGNDVMAIIEPDSLVFNIQKGRVDFLISEDKQKMTWIRSLIVLNSLKRTNVFPLITRQHVNFWRKMDTPPSCIYMDSYSELSDHMFINQQDGWKFLANFFDINHTPDFKNKFTNTGLIPTSEFVAVYRSFFNFIKKQFGEQVPVFFLHMPVQLENRREFLKRAVELRAAIETLKNEYPFLHVFEVGEGVDNFLPDNATKPIDPYHYHQDVYLDLAQQLKEHTFLGN